MLFVKIICFIFASCFSHTTIFTNNGSIDLGTKLIKFLIKMATISKKISVGSRASVEAIAKNFDCNVATVWDALRMHTNTDLANQIRLYAINNGATVIVERTATPADARLY